MDASARETVKAAFHTWDSDKNGFISKDELAVALEKIGMQLDAVQITRYFDQLTGGGGEIDPDAFVNWLFTDVAPNTAREKVREALGIDDGGNENEDEDDEGEEDDEEEEEEEEEETEDEEEDEDEEDDEDEDDNEVDSPIPSPAKAKKSRRAKGVKKKPKQLQNELNSAIEEISRLKTELEEKTKQEIERKKRKEQKAAEKEQMEKLKQAEKEAAEKAQSVSQTDAAETLAESGAVAAVAAEVPEPSVAAKPKAKKKTKKEGNSKHVAGGCRLLPGNSNGREAAGSQCPRSWRCSLDN